MYMKERGLNDSAYFPTLTRNDFIHPAINSDPLFHAYLKMSSLTGGISRAFLPVWAGFGELHVGAYVKAPLHASGVERCTGAISTESSSSTPPEKEYQEEAPPPPHISPLAARHDPFSPIQG
mmetsp:Transcript_11559/g.16000  ORF Transcript_11559/g.16000 Transcript_11559/m.16000 type:complete len:122 (-) Transcript_11559:647-1012(-)